MPNTPIPPNRPASTAHSTPPEDELVLLATVTARVPPARQPEVMQVLRKFCESLDPRVNALREAVPDLRCRTLFDLSCAVPTRTAVAPEPTPAASAPVDFDVRFAPEGIYTIDELDMVLVAAADVYGGQLDGLKARFEVSHAAPSRARPRVRIVIDLSRVVIDEEQVLEVVAADEPVTRIARVAPPPICPPVNGKAAN